MDNKVHDGELPHLVAPEDNIEELWVTLLDAANAYLKHDPDPCIMIGLSDKQTFLGLGTKAQFTMMCDGRSGAQIDRERAMLAAAPVAATQADQQAVPEGWKLAPPYSTSEMDSAGHDSLLASGNNAMQRDAEACYKAMFAVMPKPLAAAPVAAIEQPRLTAPTRAWLIDPGAGSAMDKITREAPREALRADVARRHGSITELIARPAPVAQEGEPSAVQALTQRLVSMGVTNFGFTPGPNATPEKVAAEIARTLDQLAAPSSTEASAQAAPEQAKPADGRPLIGKLMDEISQLQVLWGLNEPGALLRNSDVFRVLANASKSLSAQAAPDAVRENADRYLWLRDKAMEFERACRFTPYVVKGPTMSIMEGAELDAAIDALRTQPPTDSQGGA